MCECVDENNNINNNKRHGVWVGGWYVHIYIYYNDSCVSVILVVFGKYESGRINYV